MSGLNERENCDYGLGQPVYRGNAESAQQCSLAGRSHADVWSRIQLGTAGAAALLLIGALLAPRIQQAATERWLASSEAGYASTPFFNPETFGALEPGMTKSQVRDRIGYPLLRTNNLVGEACWIYTLPKSKRGSYTRFCAFFDHASGCLTRTRSVNVQQAHLCYLPWASDVSRDMPEVRLVDKTAQQHRAMDRGILVRAADKVEAGKTEAQVRKCLDAIGCGDVEVVTLAGNNDSATVEIGDGNETLAEDLKSGPWRSQVLVMANGRLSALPPAHGKGTDEDLQADWVWAFRHLLEPSTDGPQHLARVRP